MNDLIFYEKMRLFSNKKEILLIMMLALEYMPILMESFDSVGKIYKEKPLSESQMEFLAYANYVNPLYLFGKIKTCDQEGICNYSATFIGVFLTVLVVFYLSFITKNFFEDKNRIFTQNQTEEEKREKSNLKNFFLYCDYFYVNCTDLILKIFSICIFDVLFNCIFFFINNILASQNLNGLFLALIIFSSIFLILFCILYFDLIKNLNVIVHYDHLMKFHNDSIFSVNYDKLLLLYKLIITIENNLSLLNNSTNELSHFLLIIKIGLVPIFILVILSNILNGRELYLINRKLNLFRISFFMFNICILFFFLVFYDDFKSHAIVAICLVLSIFVTSYLISELDVLIKNGIFDSENLLDQLIFIFDSKQFIHKEELQDLIAEALNRHRFKCEFKYMYKNVKSECQICELYEIDFEKFVLIYIKKISDNKKENPNYLSREDREIFKLLKLIINDQVQKEFNIRLIFKIKKLIKRNAKSKNAVYWNAITFFDYLNTNRVNFSVTHNYQYYKTLDESCKLIETCLHSLADFFLDYHFAYGKEIYTIARDLHDKRSKILTNLSLLNYFKYGNDKHAVITDYCLIIIRFIYEVLFNSKISQGPSVLSNLSDYEEHLNNSYKNDKVIQVNYNLLDNSLMIKDISKELIDYKGRYLEDLFHDALRKELKENFISLINQNKLNSINFQCLTIIKAHNHRSILNLKLEFKIFPSIDFENIFMTGTYHFIHEDLLLIEKRFPETQFPIVNLLDFSFNFGRTLLMTQTQFRSLFKEADFNVLLKPMRMSISSNSEKTKDEFFQFGYSQYYNYVKGHMESAEDFTKEMKSSLEEIKRKAEDNLVQNFIIQNLYSLGINASLFEVCSIKSIQTENLKNKNHDITADDACLETKSTILMTEFNFESQVSVTTVNSSGAHDFISARDRKQEESLAKNSSQLKKLTIVSMVFSLLLIIFCILFMIIGILNSQKLLQSYEILISFSNLERVFYHTNTNLLDGFRIDDPNASSNIKDYYRDLYKNTNITIDVSKYVENELAFKIDLLQQRINEFQNTVMSSSYRDEVMALYSSPMDIYRMSVVGHTISLELDQYTLIEGIKLFVNKVKIILENLNEPNNIQIVTFRDGLTDFNNVDAISIGKKQQSIYELLINYPSFFKEFTKQKTLLNSFNAEKRDGIFFQTFYLSFTLMGLHLFLIIICYFTTKYFNMIINFNVSMINEIMTPSTAKEIKGKLANLLSLSLLYKISPTKLIWKLKKCNQSDGSRRKTIKRRKIDIEKANLSEEDETRNKKYKVNKSFLLTPLLKLITVLFSIYYIYSLLFYYIIDISSKKLLFNNDAFKDISDNDNQVFNSLNLLQVIILTNNTDADLYKRIYGQEEEGRYLLTSMSNLLRQRARISFWEKERSQFSDLLSYKSELMDCAYIFSGAGDSIFTSLLSNEYKDSNDKLINSLESICRKFVSTRSTEFNYLIEEFVYMIKTLLFRYENAANDVTSIVRMYNYKTFFDVSLVSIIVLRPIQYFITYAVIYQVTIQSLDSYSIMILIYFALNILVDIAIFFIIQSKVIGKILHINSELKNFIDVIRI